MNRRRVKTTLSSDLVKHFQRQGMTLQEIANLTGLSESFISRVANRERSFTVDHLLKLESSTERPLPLLLLDVISEGSVPDALLPLYQRVRSVLSSASELEYLLDGQRYRSRSNSNSSMRRRGLDRELQTKKHERRIGKVRRLRPSPSGSASSAKV